MTKTKKVKYLDLNGGVWRYRFSMNGMSYSGSCNTADLKKAQAVLRSAWMRAGHLQSPDQVRSQLQIGLNAPLEEPEFEQTEEGRFEKTTYTLAEAVGAYREHREATKVAQTPKAAAKWKAEIAQFKAMIDFIGPDVTINDLDDKMVLKIVMNRKSIKTPFGTTPKATTVNHQTWQLLRRVHTHASETLGLKVKKINWNRGSSFALEEEPFEPRELSIADEIALENARNKQGRLHFRPGYSDMFRFGLKSGFRAENLCLKWDEVDMQKRVIRVRQKGGSIHEINICDKIKAILNGVKGDHPVYCFTYSARADRRNKIKSGIRKPINEKTFRGWLERAGELAGIDVHPHLLRKTAGSRLYRATWDIAAVSKFLGHKSIALTLRHYAYIAPSHVRKGQEAANLQEDIDRAEVLASMSKRTA